ncbi:MAG: serine protease DegQ [Blastocatellia bacterium]
MSIPNKPCFVPLAVLLVSALSVLAGLSAGAGCTAYAQKPKSQSNVEKREMSAEARVRIRKAIDAVGLILVRNAGDPTDAGPRARGSAVVVRQDGVVVTNYHVITHDQSDRLFDEIFFIPSSRNAALPTSARRYRLEVVVINKSNDLALLRVVTENQPAARLLAWPTIEFGNSRGVQLLDEVIIIGFPERGGATVTVNKGIVEGQDVLADWIKTDARLIHGNSGGAAVDGEGKLIGIPTKVIVDKQPVDKDGDGFPDDSTTFGAVGFLRPAYLIPPMLMRLQTVELARKNSAVSTSKAQKPKAAAVKNEPQSITPGTLVVVRGIIKSALDEKPIAGARVGVVALGVQEVTAKNLLTWGGTNADGQFEMNRPMPLGHYTLKVKAIGYEAFSMDFEVGQHAEQLVIKLRSP